MANQPITSRVKQGLFKTKEPLLNVGPAGVDGNNKTKNVPSPAKQTKKKGTGKAPAIVNVKKSTTSGTIIKGKEIMRNKKYSDLDPSQVEAAKAWNKKNPGAKKDKVGTGKFEPDTKGPDKVKETKNNVYTTDQGDTQYAYERRNGLRSVKVNTKTERNQSVKNSRQTWRGMDDAERKATGQTRGAYMKEAKNTANKVRSSKNKAAATAGAAAALDQIKSNKSVWAEKTGTVKSADRLATQTDGSKDVVTRLANNQQEGGKVKTKKTKEENPKGSTKKTSGFFNKTSPMKMKYFK